MYTGYKRDVGRMSKQPQLKTLPQHWTTAVCNILAQNSVASLATCKSDGISVSSRPLPLIRHKCLKYSIVSVFPEFLCRALYIG